MMLAAFLFLPLLTAVDGRSADPKCSYEGVFNSLNLTEDKNLLTMIRPVNHYRNVTTVGLDVVLYAILDVKETDQKFIPYVLVLMSWQNDFITWNPDDFCGIETISLPTDALWKPDITIVEVTEKDKAPSSPYLTIEHHGLVEIKNDLFLVSTCRMRIYKFPFDVQMCNLTFKSLVHSVEQIKLQPISNSKDATELTRLLMQIQYEWLFMNITVTSETKSPVGFKQDTVVYTISMRRRSALYIANILLPILFFLCLDMASFMISDTGGEKLGYQMTVLLAVTVMQLILNEILPSSSDRIPLVAVYCIGVFTLMLFSLLETILVVHLMAKDQSMSEDGGDKTDKTDIDSCQGDWNKWTLCACLRDVSADETPTELLKTSRSQLKEEQQGSDKFADELMEGVKALTVLLNDSKEKGKAGYWTRKAKMINKVYFIFYVIAAIVFLVSMIFAWFYD